MRVRVHCAHSVVDCPNDKTYILRPRLLFFGVRLGDVLRVSFSKGEKRQRNKTTKKGVNITEGTGDEHTFLCDKTINCLQNCHTISRDGKPKFAARDPPNRGFHKTKPSRENSKRRKNNHFGNNNQVYQQKQKPPCSETVGKKTSSTLLQQRK